MNSYFATVARGLEEIAAQELEKLGAQKVRTDFTGVHFEGDRKLLYQVNLWGRTLFRILVPIREFPCRNPQQLYEGIREINWSNYLSPEKSLAVHCTGGNAQLNHTHYSALQVKNAIIDQQRDKTGKRSNVDIKNPDLNINIHIKSAHCVVSLDSTGESLHRRGYRPAMGVAPLKESLAAALFALVEWEGETCFFDPLCGVGTLPLEAALIALKIAPGLFRPQFAFEKWLDFDQALWEELKQEAKQQQRTALAYPIFGSDNDPEAIEQAKTNAQRSHLEQHIHLQTQNFSQIEPPSSSGIIICNPPYGKRLGDVEELGDFYKQMGDVFKQRFAGWTAYILTTKELSKKVGLKASRRFPVYNGSLPCTLLKYELY